VLNFCKGLNPKTTYSNEDNQLFEDAEIVWRDFLLGRRPHPGKFSQQFVIFDLIDETDVEDLPTNINRYMMNAIAMDIVGSSSSAFTWAKIGQFQIFGVIKEGSDKFENLKVHVRDGELKPGRVVLPGGMLGLYREKADQAKMKLSDISDAQFDKIDAALDVAMKDDLERLLSSKSFAAMQADARMFGEDVIIRNKAIK
jgi:hypothetical protein